MACLLCLTINAFAARQGETVLHGSAIEESGAPAGFATAFLTNAEGVLVVGTTAGEDGTASISNDEQLMAALRLLS